MTYNTCLLQSVIVVTVSLLNIFCTISFWRIILLYGVTLTGCQSCPMNGVTLTQGVKVSPFYGATLTYCQGYLIVSQCQSFSFIHSFINTVIQ